MSEFIKVDLGIVRGLAYYTGTVFEIHEVSGAERALAGGGRYDRLIEMFGGPPTAAVGFGMGDVVLGLVLDDAQLLPEEPGPAADVFVLAADAQLRPHIPAIVADLRRRGLHARFSYRSTTNVGKLLKEAGQCRARHAVILDPEAQEQNQVALKDLRSGEQRHVPLDQIAAALAE